MISLNNCIEALDTKNIKLNLYINDTFSSTTTLFKNVDISMDDIYIVFSDESENKMLVDIYTIQGIVLNDKECIITTDNFKVGIEIL